MKKSIIISTGAILSSYVHVHSVRADQFLTDTPQTLEYAQKRGYVFTSRAKSKNNTTTNIPAFEFDMGVLPDFQTYLVVPVVQSKRPRLPSEYNYGDIRLGFKYRFVHETDWIPQIGFYPKVILPVGDPDFGLGNGGDVETLPLWAQKSWGPWKLSGGGGYALNHGPHKFDYFFGGALLRRNISDGDLEDRFMLGAEIFAQGTTSLHDHSTLILNAGGHYKFTPNFSFVFSSGHSVAGKKFLVGYLGFCLLW